MDKFDVIVALSIVAGPAFLGGATITPALAQANMSMTMDNSSLPMDNSSLPMDNSSLPMDQMDNMTMMMDNSADMGTGTVPVN